MYIYVWEQMLINFNRSKQTSENLMHQTPISCKLYFENKHIAYHLQ